MINVSYIFFVVNNVKLRSKHFIVDVNVEGSGIEAVRFFVIENHTDCFGSDLLRNGSCHNKRADGAVKVVTIIKLKVNAARNTCRRGKAFTVSRVIFGRNNNVFACSKPAERVRRNSPPSVCEAETVRNGGN